MASADVSEAIASTDIPEQFTEENFLERIKDKGINGLTNVGNTCFMNSILQCLGHTSWLVKYMLLNQFRDHIKKDSMELIMVGEMYKYLQHMWNSFGQTLNPIQFFRYIQLLSLKLSHGQFIGNKQHDASEFLTFVLDILHEGLSKPINLPEHILSFDEPHFKSWIQTFKNNFSVIVKETYGQFHSRVICINCKNISTNYDPFSILSLPIPPPQPNKFVTLNDCFELFSQEEELDDENKYKCDKCSETTNAHKMTEIWKTADTLIISLKRFTKSGLKINTNVSYPVDGFELKTVNGDKNVYNLYAVCNHLGDVDGGHYFSYVKHKPTNTWYEMNDHQIRTISSTSRIVNHFAYILFYERVSK
jgi:ubiquitin carboxyl-terminal hydrolase 2/21